MVHVFCPLDGTLISAVNERFRVEADIGRKINGSCPIDQNEFRHHPPYQCRMTCMPHWPFE